MNIGIDLGTSYSSVAAEIDGRIEMIKVSTGASAFGDSYSLPTAVYADNGQLILGQAALGKRKISPSCFKNEFKRDFGTTTPYVLSGEEYLPEQLYTEIFTYFKEQSVKQTGKKIEKVYLTHPSNYGTNKKRLIEKAANNAGFFDVTLVDEPTAAAAGYSTKNKILDGDILLVYDFGGGTFDTALIKKTAKGYVHLTEPLGISKCGGVDFDRVIFDDIIRKIGEKGEFDIERLLREKRFTASLSEICIQIKHQLSQVQSHTESIAIGAYDYFEYTITKQEFEDMISPLVGSTCEKVKDILKNSGLMGSDIDRVLLVGGSTRVPLVQKMVSDTLQKEICFDADPELAVCQGAVSLGILIHNNHGKKENIINEITTVHKQNEAECCEPMEEIIGDVILGNNAYDGEWIYYMSMKPEDNNMLYKIKTDGSQKTRLSSHSSEYKIGVEGEWVYYQAQANDGQNPYFYRIRKDGREQTKISKGSVPVSSSNEYAVKDGWIYFVDPAFNYFLSRMHVDGTNITPLGCDRNVDNIAMKENWIYYSCYPSASDASLCKISIDGSNKTTLLSFKESDSRSILIAGITVFDKWVYYRIRITEKVSQGDISRYELWKINVDGSQKICVLDNCNDMLFFNIFGGRLYYGVWKDDREFIFRMNPDGTNAMTVSLEMLRREIETLNS